MAEHVEYDDEAVANALAVLRSNRGNMKRTAAQLGIPRTTLRQWAGRNEKTTTGSTRDVPAPLMDEARTKLAATFKQRAQQIMDAVTPEKLEKASARDLLIAAGIATEKAELLTGGPTARTESVRVSLVEPDALRSDKLRVIEGGKRTG